MKKITVVIILLHFMHCFSQEQSYPKKISEAIIQLDNHYSDSLKSIIRQTSDENLKNLIYPYGKDKIIYNWLDNEESELYKKIKKKGIKQHKGEVLLKAYQNHLLNKPVNNKTTYNRYKKIEKKWRAEEKKRFETDSLRGFYIPKDLDDCFKQINSSLKDSTRAQVIKLTEDEFTGRNHMGYGMWMRNNWQLWGGSRLSKYFNDKGIYHPDDMSGIILTSFHRRLLNKDILLDEQIKYYQDYWEKVRTEEIKHKQQELSEYKKDSIVIFKYRKGYTSEDQEKKDDNETCIATGKITGINEKEYLIMVKLLESCDEKGIIIYDNEDSIVYDKKKKRMVESKKREIIYMKPNEEYWFSYEDWEIKD